MEMVDKINKISENNGIKHYDACNYNGIVTGVGDILATAIRHSQRHDFEDMINGCALDDAGRQREVVKSCEILVFAACVRLLVCREDENFSDVRSELNYPELEIFMERFINKVEAANG